MDRLRERETTERDNTETEIQQRQGKRQKDRQRDRERETEKEGQREEQR